MSKKKAAIKAVDGAFAQWALKVTEGPGHGIDRNDATARHPQPPPVRGDRVVYREGYETFEESYGKLGTVTDFHWRKSWHHEGVYKLFLKVDGKRLVPFARVSEWWTPAAGGQEQ